jgi:hypothetical protein
MPDHEMPDDAIAPPWVRRVVNASDRVPLGELKGDIKAEARMLPYLLRTDETVGLHRLLEALLSLHLKTRRLRAAMQVDSIGGGGGISFPGDADLRAALAREAAELPAIIETAGEIDRARALHRMTRMCRRLLWLLLTLMLVGTCPLCHILLDDVAIQEILDCP